MGRASSRCWRAAPLVARWRSSRAAGSCGPRGAGEAAGWTAAARVGPAFGPVKPSDAVVGSFARDDDVVGVRLAQSRGRDLDEFGLAPQRGHIADAAVAHAAAQPADHLEEDIGGGALLGPPAPDALLHELARRA